MENTNIKPIVLRKTETDEVFTLEFTRDSVKYAQRNGFNIDEIDVKPMVVVPDLFFYAFRANHKNITHEKSDKILYEDLGGMSDAMLERLIRLYHLPYEALLHIGDEEVKNAKMTVEM